MSLAQRVRDCRYAKGWGPDELANRASISRTALYQIESGKTEQPRAGTLRRIAEALSIPTETLLGPTSVMGVSLAFPSVNPSLPSSRPRVETRDEEDVLRLNPMAPSVFASNSPRVHNQREMDLERKLLDLLRSPLGEGVARIVEESHRLLPG